MEIIIGRDANTSQLKITIGQQSKVFGAVGCIPITVSRQHCSLTDNPDGTYRIVNLKPQNITYVNGVEVMVKNITEKDKIELGPDKYLVSWDLIKGLMPKMVDFRPLKHVWEEYDEHKLDQQIADRKFNSLRSITGLITMGAIALSIVYPDFRETPLYIGVYLLAIFISVCFTVKAYQDSSRGPMKTKKLTEDFQQHYVCPNCGHFLGFQSYDVLMQNTACPHCKAKIKK